LGLPGIQRLRQEAFFVGDEITITLDLQFVKAYDCRAARTTGCAAQKKRNNYVTPTSKTNYSTEADELRAPG